MNVIFHISYFVEVVVTVMSLATYIIQNIYIRLKQVEIQARTSDNMKTLSKMCIIFISITCVLTLPAKYSDHSPIVDTINRLQEIKGENLLKLNSGKWSSVTSSTHFVATTPENKKSGNVMVPVIIGSIFGGIVALYLIYLLLLLSVVTWTCIFQRFNFHQYVELIE